MGDQKPYVDPNASLYANINRTNVSHSSSTSLPHSSGDNAGKKNDDKDTVVAQLKEQNKQLKELHDQKERYHHFWVRGLIILGVLLIIGGIIWTINDEQNEENNEVQDLEKSMEGSSYVMPAPSHASLFA